MYLITHVFVLWMKVNDFLMFLSFLISKWNVTSFILHSLPSHGRSFPSLISCYLVVVNVFLSVYFIPFLLIVWLWLMVPFIPFVFIIYGCVRSFCLLFSPLCLSYVSFFSCSMPLYPCDPVWFWSSFLLTVSSWCLQRRFFYSEIYSNRASLWGKKVVTLNNQTIV